MLSSVLGIQVLVTSFVLPLQLPMQAAMLPSGHPLRVGLLVHSVEILMLLAVFIIEVLVLRPMFLILIMSKNSRRGNQQAGKRKNSEHSFFPVGLHTHSLLPFFNTTPVQKLLFSGDRSHRGS